MNKIIFVTGERMLRQVHHVFTAFSSLYTAKHCFIVVLLPALMLHRNEWVIYNFSYWIYFLIEVCVWSMRGCTCRMVVFILYWQLNYHGNINIVRTLYRMSVYMIVQVKTLFLIENQQKFWSFIYVPYMWHVMTKRILRCKIILTLFRTEPSGLFLLWNTHSSYCNMLHVMQGRRHEIWFCLHWGMFQWVLPTWRIFWWVLSRVYFDGLCLY